MAVTLTNGSTGLFDYFSLLVEAADTYASFVSSMRTDLDAATTDIQAAFTDSSVVSAVSSVNTQMETLEQNVSNLMSAIQNLVSKYVIQMVDDDANLPQKTEAAALQELVRQMVSSSDNVENNVVSVSVATGGSNTGDCQLVASKKAVDGEDNQSILAETIDFDGVTSGSSVLLQASSDTQRSDLSGLGPAGSGLSAKNITVVGKRPSITGAAQALATLSGSTVLPTGWVVKTGSLGTTVHSSVPEADTITVTGSPSSGTWRATFTTSTLGAQSTASLPYNATNAQLLAAIRALTGFENVTVDTTGTTPNFTHTITFYGLPEAVTTATVESTDTGTYTAGSGTAFTRPAISGHSIVLDSNGSETTGVAYRVTHLNPKTAYIPNAWLAADTTPASGAAIIKLTNGLGGSTITDDAGTALSCVIDLTDLTTAFQSSAKITTTSDPFWMTPTSLPSVIYLEISFTTAPPSGREVYVDAISLSAAQAAYTGGPWLGAFQAATGLKAGDEFTLTVANDYSGRLGSWWSRFFNMRTRSFQLPSDSSPSISDSLVPSIP